MQRLKKIICIITCMMLFVFISSGCVKKDRTKILNFLNYGENIDNETLKLFEKEYGIKVNVETFDDMETMYNKVKAGAVKYDVILVSDSLMTRMINEDLLRELNKENIPNISQMDEEYLNLSIDPGNIYSMPYMFGTVGLIYNTDYVDEDVDSWDILWNEKYKNDIFMFNTYRDSIGVALKMLGYSLNTTDEKELNEAKEVLLKQKSLVKIYGSDLGTETIANGETYVNMIWSGEGLNLQDEYPNLKYIVPKEGANFWIDSLCIPRNAENVEGAEKFINFVSDKDAAFRIADEIGYTTPNKEAKNKQSDEVKNNPNAYMKSDVMSRCEIYEDLSSSDKEKYMDIWTALGVESGEE